MKQLIILFILPLMTSIDLNHSGKQNPIKDKGMSIEWEHEGDYLIVKIETPTKGWQAIGFNTDQTLTGTYLVMSTLDNEGQVVIGEHYVEKPGTYNLLSSYGIEDRIKVISGSIQGGKTKISYKIPVHPSSRYHKGLSKGKAYTLHYAYSAEKDFQHHSRFRSRTKIIL